MIDYEIEELKEEHLDSYKELIDECFGGSNDISEYKNHQKNEHYIILVARKDDEIIGSIAIYKIDLYTFSFQPCLVLFNVAVKEKYRNNKIAKNLMDHVIDYAKQNGYKSISLTCLSDAYDAHGFYESVGFKKTSSLKYNLNL